MSGILVLLLVLLGIGALVAVLMTIPFQRWSFRWGDHDIVVTNYMFRETVAVDGQTLRSTQTAGDGLTWAEHELRLPHEPALRIRIEMQGVTMRCAAWQGETLVYDNLSGARPAEETAPDARLAAARVLLRDLARLDPQGATEIERVLQEVLASEQEARQRAAAHSALGGDGQELTEQASREVELVLSELRKLHLSLDSSGDKASAARREAMARMSAAREVQRLK